MKIRPLKQIPLGTTDTNTELPEEVQKAIKDGRLLFVAWITEEDTIGMKTIANSAYIDDRVQSFYSAAVAEVLTAAIEQSLNIQEREAAKKKDAPKPN